MSQLFNVTDAVRHIFNRYAKLVDLCGSASVANVSDPLKLQAFRSIWPDAEFKRQFDGQYTVVIRADWMGSKKYRPSWYMTKSCAELAPSSGTKCILCHGPTELMSNVPIEIFSQEDEIVFHVLLHNYCYEKWKTSSKAEKQIDLLYWSQYVSAFPGSYCVHAVT